MQDVKEKSTLWYSGGGEEKWIWGLWWACFIFILLIYKALRLWFFHLNREQRIRATKIFSFLYSCSVAYFFSANRTKLFRTDQQNLLAIFFTVRRNQCARESPSLDIPGITLEKKHARKHPRACTLFLEDLLNLPEDRASCVISLFVDCLLGKIMVPTILE